MMMGKSGHPSTAGLITVDVGNMEAAPPLSPRTQKAVIGRENNVYDPILSPRYFRNYTHVETADFLRSCRLCNRSLAAGRDIYMYRGDTAFCSFECREQQMKQDERKERRGGATAVVKNVEGHRRWELAAAASETSGESKSTAAI